MTDITKEQALYLYKTNNELMRGLCSGSPIYVKAKRKGGNQSDISSCKGCPNFPTRRRTNTCSRPAAYEAAKEWLMKNLTDEELLELLL